MNIVFHSAATVKFDEKIKLSVTINMLGTQCLVALCKRMANLEALVSLLDITTREKNLIITSLNYYFYYYYHNNNY